MENSLNDELLCSLKDELREVTAQINVHSEKLMDLLDQKRIVSQLTREMSHLTPVIIEYRGNPKQYVSVVLDAINLGRLTYDGVANCEQTFRALASVVDVISPKNGKTLSVETLVSYEKKSVLENLRKNNIK